MDLEQKKAARYKLLHRLYQLSDGDENDIEPAFDIGKEHGWTKEETYKIVQYLDGEGLLKEWTLNAGIGITHEGVVQIEKALSDPTSATQYFPPAANIILIGQAINSPIQQASPGSTQTTSVITNDVAMIKDFTSALVAVIDQLGLSDAMNTDLRAEINTTDSQLNSSKPKKSIIKTSLTSILDILRSAAANVTASMFIEKTSDVLAQL